MSTLASRARTPSIDAPVALPIVALRREELPVDTVELARFMVGKYLVRDPGEGADDARLAGRIVEMEAYPVGDSTSHAFIGRRAWNASMFLARGHAYVRLTYGSAWMLNMSSEAEEVGAGVLFRAVEPLEGLAVMAQRRSGAPLRDLTRGPGRLTQAYGIGASFDGVDLCSGQGLWIGRLDETVQKAVRKATQKTVQEPLQIAPQQQAARAVGVTTRIGLSRETHRLLRFYELGSPFVSGPRKLLTSSA